MVGTGSSADSQRAPGPVLHLFHETLQRGGPPVHNRVLMDNVTLAFAALFRTMSRGETDRAEQVIVGTPFQMVAYRVRVSAQSETLHFEIRPTMLAR